MTIDEIYIDYITNHFKKFDSYLIKKIFKLAFNNFDRPIKIEFHYKTKSLHLKRFLLFWKEYFILKVYKFFQKIDMGIKTISEQKFINSSLQRYVFKITDDYDNITFTNCTNNEEKRYNYTNTVTNNNMCLIIFMLDEFNDIYLYPSHPVRCILTEHSECGKSVFLTNLT